MAHRVSNGNEDLWIAVELPEELVEQLIHYARERGTSLSRILAEAIANFLENGETRSEQPSVSPSKCSVSS